MTLNPGIVTIIIIIIIIMIIMIIILILISGGRMFTHLGKCESPQFPLSVCYMECRGA